MTLSETLVKDLRQSLAEDKDREMTLLVEDDEAYAYMMRLLMDQLRRKSIHASTAEQAIEYFQKENIAFVFLDLNLNGKMDGLNVLKFVREKYPKIPVIIMSGFIDPEIYEEITKYGSAGVLEKPFNKKLLEETFLKYS